MAQHVPAWKRLGLKLKYAKDTADDISASMTSTLNEDSLPSSKRNREPETLDTDGSPRKRAKPADQVASATKSSSVNGVGIATNAVAPAEPLATLDKTEKGPLPKLTRKKSVTFTPETKVEDGLSAGEYFNIFPASFNADEYSDTPTEIVPVPVSTQPEAESPDQVLPAKSVRTKEKNSKQKSKDKSDAPSSTAYLEYLDRFHTDKASWKFNKAKQNDVLRNVWNVHRIPPSYDDALLAYIHGLQGVNARQRLGEAAQEILDSDTNAETTSEPSAEQTDEQRQQAEKRARAEAIIKQLQSWSIPPPMAVTTQPAAIGAAKHMKFAEDTSVTAANGTNSAPAAKRKRKSRTEVSSSESSSSDSSSESDSDTS
jgi:hypothetical protein